MLQADSGAAVSPSRAGADTIGTVISVTGSQATIKLAALQPAQEARITVGKFAAIRSGPVTVIGVVTRLAERPGESADEPAISIAELDLLGELKGEAGARFFQRGVTEYPALGDESELLGGDDLRLIYDLSGADVIVVGQLQQDAELPAYIKVNEMLAKHFAFFGTTGVGKSTGVALLLRKILEARPDLRIFLVDPHNEYGRSFGDCALVLNPKNLRLPFWLFNFEETVDVFFGGRPGIEEEVEILSEAIPRAKTLFAADRAFERMSLRKNPEESGFTQDTPVPYRLADLVALIGERMGKLENRSVAGKYARLITRIELVRKDPRYAFMFDNANVGGDVIVEVLSQLFRLPPEGKPMTVMQLAGFPAEVIDSVVSVLGRMAFDFGLWSDGAVPMLFVCEEAHRYAPADRTLGFGPTRKAHQPHRQGGTEIRRPPRPHHPAPGRARPHHHLADEHHLRHAHGQRARPGDHPLGGLRRRREPACLRPLARHPRGLRLRRGRLAADPAPLRRGRRAAHPAQLVGARRSYRSLRRHQRPVHRPRRRPLARRHHQQPAEAQRAARRGALGLDRDGAPRPRRFPRPPVESVGRRHRRPCASRTRAAQAHVGMDQAQARPSPQTARPVTVRTHPREF